MKKILSPTGVRSFFLNGVLATFPQQIAFTKFNQNRFFSLIKPFCEKVSLERCMCAPESVVRDIPNYVAPDRYVFSTDPIQKPKRVFHFIDQYREDVGNHVLRFMREVMRNFPNEPIEIIVYKAQSGVYPDPAQFSPDQKHQVLISGSNKDVSTDKAGRDYGAGWIDYCSTHVIPAIVAHNDQILSQLNVGKATLDNLVEVFGTCSGQQVTLSGTVGAQVVENYEMPSVRRVYDQVHKRKEVDTITRNYSAALPALKTTYLGGVREMDLNSCSLFPTGGRVRLAVSHCFQTVTPDNPKTPHQGHFEKLGTSDICPEDITGQFVQGFSKPFYVTSQGHPEKSLVEILLDIWCKLIGSDQGGISDFEREKMIEGFLEIVNPVLDKPLSKEGMAALFKMARQSVSQAPAGTLEKVTLGLMDSFYQLPFVQKLAECEEQSFGRELLRQFLTVPQGQV